MIIDFSEEDVNIQEVVTHQKQILQLGLHAPVPRTYTGVVVRKSYSNGFISREHYLHGRLHRLDGPAIQYGHSLEEWYFEGKLHRTDGPAIYYRETGDAHFYVLGTRVTAGWFKEFSDKMRPLDQTALELIKLLKPYSWFLGLELVWNVQHQYYFFKISSYGRVGSFYLPPSELNDIPIVTEEVSLNSEQEN